MAYKMLRLPSVIELTGLSRSSIYLRMSNNEFPRSVSLGGRAIAWLEEDINKWLEQCIAESKK